MDDEFAVSEVLAAVYAAPLKPDLWFVALERLSKAIGINQAGLLEHNPGQGRHKIFASVGDSIRDGGPLYEQHYWQYDEWTGRFPKRPLPGGLVCGETVWPEIALRGSAFFNEFLQKYDVCQMVGVPSYAGPNAFEVLSVYRGPEEPAFDEDQYRVLKFLAPHLDTALATRRRLINLDSKVNDLTNALNHLQAALILLDRRGMPLVVNTAAREICHRCDGLLLGRMGLEAQTIRESAELQALIRRTVSSVIGKDPVQGGAVLISRRSGRPLQVLVSPLSSSMIDAPQRATATLLICDPDKELPLPTTVLRELFGLTPAESRLALLLLHGMSLPETAEELGVSRETVRSQLRAVLQKTGAHRQSELIKLLVGMSARPL
jgi:DNA-binding CsgD family transcriptional regulator